MKKPKTAQIIAIIDLKKEQKLIDKDTVNLCDPGQKARSLVITEQAHYLSPQTVAYYQSEIGHHYPQL